MYDIRENEHQELFTLGVNPTKPIDIFIPSPLGRLAYFVFVRVPKADVARLSGVSMHVCVGGLRTEDYDIAAGEGAANPAVIPSIDPQLAWFCPGMISVSRGNGTLTFNNWPADITSAELLLCTWPRFIANGQADEWIAGQVDPSWAPTGVPLGGIGGGRVDICRDGRFRNFSMNNNQDCPLENPDGLPGAYMAISEDDVTVDIATRPIVTGHLACKKIDYTPRFPQAILKSANIIDGIDVAVTLSGTLTPQDHLHASIPGFIVRWSVTNNSSSPRTITCRMGWPNLIGIGGSVAKAESKIGYGDGYYHHYDDPTGRKISTEKIGDNITALQYTGTPKQSYLSASGDHYLGTIINEQSSVSTISIADDGELSTTITIPAGATITTDMAVVTAMPNWVDSLSVDLGMYWQNNFTNGAEMLAELLNNADAIIADTGSLSSLIDDSTLPEWLRERLSNCNYPLVSNSVYTREGKFSVNEGPTEMAGTYGTIDQRLAAHPSTQLLFPQLNDTELRLFAAIQGDDGGIQHDLGGGHLSRTAGSINWPDLTCSFIIQTARHAWSTGDAAFEKDIFPRAKRALLKHAKWADEGNGVAQVGDGLGTSYDGYHYFGTTGYMATLWLAALAIYERWSSKMGDDSLNDDVKRWRQAAIARLNADIWNGEYFIAYGSVNGVKRDTCHAGQVAGQVFNRMLTGTDVLDTKQLLSCINAVITQNGNARFNVPPDEVGTDGAEAVEYGWLPYVEGFMMTAVASVNDPRMMPIWQRMMASVDDSHRHPCDTRLMYRPNGELSWGTYYMTAPASWLVYDAWLDFFYTTEDGALRLRAENEGKYPIVHPNFWATATIKEGTVSLLVQRVFTDGNTITQLELLTGSTAQTVDCINMETAGKVGDYTRYKLPEAFEIKVGETLSWRVVKE
jgi:non-lysosomal glucosylceramidase